MGDRLNRRNATRVTGALEAANLTAALRRCRTPPSRPARPPPLADPAQQAAYPAPPPPAPTRLRRVGSPRRLCGCWSAAAGERGRRVAAPAAGRGPRAAGWLGSPGFLVGRTTAAPESARSRPGECSSSALTSSPARRCGLCTPPGTGTGGWGAQLLKALMPSLRPVPRILDSSSGNRHRRGVDVPGRREGAPHPPVLFRLHPRAGPCLSVLPALPAPGVPSPRSPFCIHHVSPVPPSRWPFCV